MWRTVLSLVGGVALAASAVGEPLRVGSVVAERGEKASGYLEVPDGVDAGTRIPVSLVHGARQGPVLALVAGTHGYEYTAILALERLLPQLEPERLAGSVILVHMASPPTFYGRRIYYGPDGKNQNRVYPGRPDGTVSERIAHALTTQVIDRATHVVDMHCGDGNESLRPYSYWQVSGNADVDAAAKRMVLAWGLDHIVVDRERPRDATASVYTSNTAVLRGKPAITTESGALGQSDEASIAAHEQGALSLMRELGMLEGSGRRVEHPIWIEPWEVLRAPATGVWHPARDRKDSVGAGTVIGTLTDPFGNVLHELRAPFAGELLYVVATPPVSEGEPLAMVGRVLEGEPQP
jgi:predicted deacylase